MSGNAMKNFKQREPHKLAKTVTTVFIGIAAVVILFLGANGFERLNEQQNLELTLQAIKKATVQCYANEGRYPSELSYLEKYYNVDIDYDSFNVLYDTTASNMMPNINVFIK